MNSYCLCLHCQMHNPRTSLLRRRSLGSSRNLPPPRTSAEAKGTFLALCSKRSAGEHVEITEKPAGTKRRSQNAGHRSQVKCHRSQVAGCRSQVTGQMSQVTGHRLQVTGHQPVTCDLRFVPAAEKTQLALGYCSIESQS